MPDIRTSIVSIPLGSPVTRTAATNALDNVTVRILDLEIVSHSHPDWEIIFAGSEPKKLITVEIAVMSTTTTTTTTIGDVTVTVTEHFEVRDGAKYKITERSLRGPKGPVERMQLKKYGAEVTNPLGPAPVGDDVFLEFLPTRLTAEPDTYVPNGLYIMRAHEEGWPESDIKELIRSDRPDLVWFRLFKEKLDAACAKSQAERLATMNTEDRKRQMELAAAKAKTDVASGVKLGLRARMEQKKLIASATADDAPVKSGNSLSERMRSKREAHDDNEHLRKLYLSNIPLDFTRDDIQDRIPVKPQKVILLQQEDHEGHKTSTGSAFVIFYSDADAQEALELLTRARWENCVIAVSLARPRE